MATKRYWCLRGPKDEIKTVDRYGQTQTRHKLGAHYLDCNINNCKGYGPQGDRLKIGEEPCYDPENTWCIPNDVPIYEAKRLWWKHNISDIERGLDNFYDDIDWLQSFLEERLGVRIDVINDMTIEEKRSFIGEIRERFYWRNYPTQLEMDCYFNCMGQEL